jgi:Tripartite tricarboxylate transporter TctB family
LLQANLHKRDFYAGGVTTLLGAGVTLNAASYDVGSMTHMGPGMFPLMLGIVLTFIGILIFGNALATPLGEDEHVLPRQREWRGWFCILAGPVLFIIFGEFFGMAPATFMCVFVSALGDRTSTLKSSAILAAGVTFFGVLLFSYVLQLPFPIFRWGH